MYYFAYYINILLIKRSRLSSRFKKKTRRHSFMALNRVSDVPAADWLSQTRDSVVIRFLSVVEIPKKHSSLYNKILFKPSSRVIL